MVEISLSRSPFTCSALAGYAARGTLTTPAELLPLIGIPMVVGGFALRLNPLLVVMGAALVTGLAVGIAPLDLLELIGEKFLGARSRFSS